MNKAQRIWVIDLYLIIYIFRKSEKEEEKEED